MAGVVALGMIDGEDWAADMAAVASCNRALPSGTDEASKLERSQRLAELGHNCCEAHRRRWRA
jgi:hypothetical protein